MKGISRKWDHTKLPILVAADDGDDNTRERDVLLLPNSKGRFHESCAIKSLYMSCLRMKNPKSKFICFMQLPSFK